MRPICTNIPCKSSTVRKDGTYFRQSDSQTIQRYQCKVCGKKFSKSSFELEYRQKKRRINHLLFGLLASGVSQRRAARLLNVNRTTIERRLPFLAKKARLMNARILSKFHQSIKHVQFDDLITIEHTKLKPLTVSSAVDQETRLILGCEVAQIPAFGRLAKLSRRKYGARKSFHRDGLRNLFRGLTKTVSPNARFESDEHVNYPPVLKEFFPLAEHFRHKGGRGCVTGQGELKRKYFDPLFSINHTYAMLRANINRLFRRSWNTTKNPVHLKYHLEIYQAYHNSKLIKLEI